MAYPTLSNLSTQFDCARLGWTTPIPQAGRRYSTDSEPLEHVKSSLCCFKLYHISFLFDLMLRSFVSLHITLWSCLMPHHIIVPIVSYYLALPEVLRLLRQTEKHFQSRPSQGHWTRRHKLLCLPHKIISEARALYVRVCSFHKPRSVKETTLYIYIYSVWLLLESRNFPLGGTSKLQRLPFAIAIKQLHLFLPLSLGHRPWRCPSSAKISWATLIKCHIMPRWCVWDGGATTSAAKPALAASKSARQVLEQFHASRLVTQWKSNFMILMRPPCRRV